MATLDGLSKKAQSAVSAALESGEEVRVAVSGENGSALVATNRRVFVFKKGITSGSFFSKQLNSWDFANVSGIEVKQGMTTRGLVVQVPGVAPVTKFGRFENGAGSVWEAPNALMADKDGLDDAVAILRTLIADHQRPHASASDNQAPDPVDQIRRLAELRDQGILTDEEFQAKKRQLLGL